MNHRKPCTRTQKKQTASSCDVHALCTVCAGEKLRTTLAHTTHNTYHPHKAAFQTAHQAGYSTYHPQRTPPKAHKTPQSRINQPTSRINTCVVCRLHALHSPPTGSTLEARTLKCPSGYGTPQDISTLQHLLLLQMQQNPRKPTPVQPCRCALYRCTVKVHHCLPHVTHTGTCPQQQHTHAHTGHPH